MMRLPSCRAQRLIARLGELKMQPGVTASGWPPMLAVADAPLT